MNKNAFQYDAYRPLFTVWGVSLTETPLDRDIPGHKHPRTETPLDRPPLVNRITDRCKNITFPQLRLRAVTIHSTHCRLFLGLEVCLISVSWLSSVRSGTERVATTGYEFLLASDGFVALSSVERTCGGPSSGSRSSVVFFHRTSWPIHRQLKQTRSGENKLTNSTKINWKSSTMKSVNILCWWIIQFFFHKEFSWIWKNVNYKSLLQQRAQMWIIC